MEWYQSSKTGGYWAVAAFMIVIIAYLSLRDTGFGWMQTWWLWLFVALPAPGMYLLTRAGYAKAGADWAGNRSG